MKLKILLVEDHQHTLNAVQRFLNKAGHEVATASSVDAALKVDPSEFHLLLSDIGLPDGDGWEIMRRFRTEADIPGIALSALSSNEDIARSRAAGFSDHLVKPVDGATLREAIDRVTKAA